jgi:YVTN family beta-propeller protein
VALTGQLAGALDAAHARGLVHRDVKPSNALVTRVADAEHVYMCDFGLSKQAAGEVTLSESGVVLGTLMYMAPEVIRSGVADARSDLYSLGCVLFECLTGEGPFEGPSQAAVIYGHLEEPPPRVSKKRPGLPQELDAVVARALDKDPDQRWTSGAELMEAARAALAGTAPKAKRLHATRRRALGAALAVLVAALAGVLALSRDSGGPARLATVQADAIAIIDHGKAVLKGEVALDGAPTTIAAGAGAVWVTDEDRDVVARVDKKTLTIRQTITVGHGPSALAVEPHGVWVANRQDGTVSVISPQNNKEVKTIPVGRDVDGICIGSGSVWVASPLDYAVVRIDPDSLRKTATVRLDTPPAQLACGNGVVWASSPSSGLVTEISAKTAAQANTIQVGRGASAIALGADAVWVTNAPDGMVSRIDRGAA